MKLNSFALVSALLLGMALNAQVAGKIGNMSVAAFNKINSKGNAAVAAITATSTPLSAADQQLTLQVAAGGQRQLAISQAVVAKATDPNVKLLATSEVEEQTGLSAKLKEIATAKGVTLPEGPDADAQALVSTAQGLDGASLDSFYINQSGVKGHQLLLKTMTTVSGTAKDATLKKISIATLPVIKTHLAVSKAEQSKMKLSSKLTSKLGQ